MTGTYSLSLSHSSFFWDSFHSLNDAEFCPHKESSLDQEANLSIDSMARVLGIIECAEELMLSTSDLLEEDLEPIPIGPNGVQVVISGTEIPVHHSTSSSKLDITYPSIINFKNEQIVADTDCIFDSFINSMKRRSDVYDDHHDDKACQEQLTKKQKVSTSSMHEILAAGSEGVSVVPSPSFDITTNDPTSTNQDGEPARFRRYQADQWMERFEDLIAFKAENGHCLVPHSFPLNQQLAQWVKRQRYQYKLKVLGRHSTLTDEREKELENMGFVWDSHKAAWDERLEDLKKYRSKFGNCLVPTNYDDDRSLAVWVKCQRRQMRLFRSGKRSTMTLERFEELDRLGFDWNPRNL